jgi:secretory phospholipase A2
MNRFTLSTSLYLIVVAALLAATQASSSVDDDGKSLESSEEVNIGEDAGVLDGERPEAENEGKAVCKFLCEIGSPIQDPDHTPGHNGCGSYGFNVEFKRCPYLTECCNKHDVCYDACGTSRDECDDVFRDCTTKSASLRSMDAETRGLCSSYGHVMYYTVRLAGCPAFKNAQEKACICQ